MVSLTFRLFAVSTLILSAANAQPVVTAVLNNASYALPGLPNAGIAQGSLMAVFGSNLGSSTVMTATALPLTNNMGGTSVTVTSGGATLNAPMVYTTAGQIGAILPSNTPTGPATVRVTYNSQTSAPFSINVVRSAFGVFTSNQQGSGPGAVQNAISGSDQPINALNRPARPGQTVILWGTGLGPTSSSGDVGIVTGDLPVNVEVWVGGRQAQVTYRGRSGCCVGIDQIVFTVPEGVEGCYVPVVIKTGDVVSNFASISVARTGNVCSDPVGFSPEDIQSAQNTGNLRTGYIGLSRVSLQMNMPGVGDVRIRTDSGSGSFFRYTLNQLLASRGLSGGEGLQVSPGSCSTLGFRAEGENQRPVDPIRPVMLDAGPAITVTGPRGTKQLTRQQGVYSGELGGGGISGLPVNIPGQNAQPDFLEPGQYTISAPGGSGADSIGNFNVQFTMPQMLTWANQAQVTSVNRASGQQITWTGGDPNTYVFMYGYSMGHNVAGIFVCLERASAGQFTIPSYVLMNLPATTGDAMGALAVGGTTNPVRFTARDLDAGYISASSLSQHSVTYR